MLLVVVMVVVVVVVVLVVAVSVVRLRKQLNDKSSCRYIYDPMFILAEISMPV